MSAVRDATISGFNEYLQTMRKDEKNNKYEFTLTLFDTETHIVTKAMAVGDVPELTIETYKPDGMTALYDAVCMTIKDVKPKKGEKAIAIIMTDGQENSSKEYTEKEMKAMVEEREKEGNWTFVYLGANQDSYAVAQKYGIAAGNTVNFNATSAGMGATMRTVATSNVMYASSDATTTTDYFTGDAKKNIEDTK